MRVRVVIETGFCASVHNDVIEVDDNATEDEIHQECLDHLFNKIGWSYEILPEGAPEVNKFGVQLGLGES